MSTLAREFTQYNAGSKPRCSPLCCSARRVVSVAIRVFRSYADADTARRRDIMKLSARMSNSFSLIRELLSVTTMLGFLANSLRSELFWLYTYRLREGYRYSGASGASPPGGSDDY